MGRPSVVTAANCFAHIEDVHAIVEGIVDMLAPDGVFISESHYLIGLLDTLQYDTIYHEHLRYYSLGSLKHLLGDARTRSVPRPADPDRMAARSASMRRGKGTHAGAGQRATDARRPSRAASDARAARGVPQRRAAVEAAADALMRDIKEKGARICGISAPSRASTLVNYVGLDDGDHRLRLRDRRLAEDRQVHARHADPGGRGEPAVRRPAGRSRSSSPGTSPTSLRRSCGRRAIGASW